MNINATQKFTFSWSYLMSMQNYYKFDHIYNHGLMSVNQWINKVDPNKIKKNVYRSKNMMWF